MTETTTGTVRVWDPLVRAFHWTLVAAFAVAWLGAEETLTLHEIAGYTVAALLALRLVWGLVGSRHARFADFVRGPATTRTYLRNILRGRERRYIGHNPAGAAMIVVLIVTLAGTALTGWLVADRSRLAYLPDMPQIATTAWANEDGGQYGEDGEGGGGVLSDLHAMLANLSMLLVALHLGGVALASVRHHENLARAMVTGRKRAPGPDDVD